MEALTRLYLVRAPAHAPTYGEEPVSPTHGRFPEPAPAEIRGGRSAASDLDEARVAARVVDAAKDRARILATFATRPLDLVVSSPHARALQLASEIAKPRELALRVDARLAPREHEAWPREGTHGRHAEWGSRGIDGAVDDAFRDPLESVTASVIAAADRIAREHPRREIALVLHFDGARALLARAVGLEHGLPLELEPGAIAVLDWAHPEAREFQHSLVAIALDRDVAPPPTQAHRYPGGASVLPGPR